MGKIIYLHEEMYPIIPGLGDVKICPTLDVLNAKCTIEVAKCVSLLDHHVVYQFSDGTEKVIPLEVIDKWGMSNIDNAVKWILDSYMRIIIEEDCSNERKYCYSSSDKDISQYFEKIQKLMSLSRQALKEAERAKRNLEKLLETEGN